jgi:pimeloyl-ACP methyl ester carboxylesterase
MTDTAVAQDTLETAPTEYIDAAGIRFGYRAFGKATGTPLIFLQHFTGNMDSWDPAVVNGLSKNRPVVVFDNAGVGKSTGVTPNNVDQMTEDASAFMSALGLKTVDLLGYSLGGMIAQKLAAEHGALARKFMLVATAPQGGEEHLMAVLADANARKGAGDTRLPLFFTTSDESEAAGRAFLQRAKARTMDRDPESGKQIFDAHAKAIISWCATKDPENRILRAIKQPVLIVSGSNDTMLPNDNAVFTFKHLSNGELILYPDSGHGVLFQYPERFVEQAELFLDS